MFNFLYRLASLSNYFGEFNVLQIALKDLVMMLIKGFFKIPVALLNISPV